MAKKKQTFKKGDRVIFKMESDGQDYYHCAQDFFCEPEPTDAMVKLLEAIDGATFKIKGLETYTELGDKDYEYYNISLRADILYLTLQGVSGYHLTKVEDGKTN